MAGTLASSLLAQSIGPSPAWSACARTGSSLRGGTRQGHSAPLRDRLRRPLTEPTATGADLHQRRAAARHTFGGRTTRAHTLSIRASETDQSNYRIVRSGTQGEASAAGHTGVAPGRPPPSASAFPAGRCTHLPPRPGCSGHLPDVPATWRVTPHRPTALFPCGGHTGRRHYPQGWAAAGMQRAARPDRC